MTTTKNILTSLSQTLLLASIAIGFTVMPFAQAFAPTAQAAHNGSVTYTNNHDGTGTFDFHVKDGDNNPITGLNQADFSVSSDSDSNFDFSHSRFSNFADEGGGDYTVTYAPNEPVNSIWDISIEDHSFKQGQSVVVTINDIDSCSDSDSGDDYGNNDNSRPIQNTDTSEYFETIQDAIDDCDTDDGDTITLKDQTHTITSTVDVNKKLTIVGEEGSEIETSGTNYVMRLQADGIVLDGLTITKTDETGTQNMIQILADDVTVKNSSFTGGFELGDSHVERALEVAGGVTGLLIEGNTFKNIRQPAYINNTVTGDILNNHVADTKGWVIVSDTDLNFDGNTWGENAVDIAIINQDDSANNYSCSRVAQMKANNNNADIDNQVQDSPCQPEGPYGDQVLGEDLSEIYVCHATESDSNPYNKIKRNANNLFKNGHLGDDGPHDNDIVPPLSYLEDDSVESYPGKNWGANGQETWNNNCGEEAGLTVEILKPTSSPVSNSATTTISGSASGLDKLSMVKITDLDTYNTVFGPNNNVGLNDGNWSVEVPAGTLTEGHEMQVIAFEKKDGEAAEDKAYFTVETEGPKVQILEPTENENPNANVVVSNGDPLTISGTISNFGAPINGDYMDVTIGDLTTDDPNIYIDNFVELEDGEWSMEVPAGELPEGHKMHVKASAEDTNGMLGDDKAFFTVEDEAAGAIEVTKYDCDDEANIPDGIEGDAPNGCDVEEGAMFGYNHQDKEDGNDTGPWPRTDILGTTTTNSDGIATFSGLNPEGRYNLIELDESGEPQSNDEILAFYCEDDGVSNPDDNLEYNYLTADETDRCVAYNKSDDGIVGGDGPNECEAGDGFADNYSDFDQGDQENGENVASDRNEPSEALGQPEGDDTENFVSLGFDGEITLEFDHLIDDNSGNDFAVYETTYGDPDHEDYPEQAEIFVSQDGENFESIGTATEDVSEFDLADSSYDWVQFIKVVDTSDKGDFSDEGDADGFDLDGIEVINCEESGEPEQCTPEATLDLDTEADNANAVTEVSVDDETVSNSNSFDMFASGDAAASSANTADGEVRIERTTSGFKLYFDGVSPNDARQFKGSIQLNDVDLSGYSTSTISGAPLEDGSHGGFVDEVNVDEQNSKIDFHLRVGGGNDSFVISGLKKKCEEPQPEPETTTIEGTKFNDMNGDEERGNEEPGLEDWTILARSLDADPVDTLEINPRDEAGEDSVDLSSGTKYIVEVSGTYGFDDGDSNRVADAEYYSENGFSDHGEWGSDNPNEDQRTLDVVIDNKNINWGPYNGNNHLYKTVVEGDDAPINAAVFERQASHYNDNEETSLDVEIYEAEYTTITDENGDYTLTVPEGEYQVVEMNQEGWTQTAPADGGFYHDVDVTEGSSSGVNFGNQLEEPREPEVLSCEPDSMHHFKTGSSDATSAELVDMTTSGSQNPLETYDDKYFPVLAADEDDELYGIRKADNQLVALQENGNVDKKETVSSNLEKPVGMTFSSDGTLYAVDEPSDQLYEIDRSDGSVSAETSDSSDLLVSGGDMFVDEEGDIIYVKNSGRVYLIEPDDGFTVTDLEDNIRAQDQGSASFTSAANVNGTYYALEKDNDEIVEFTVDKVNINLDQVDRTSFSSVSDGVAFGDATSCSVEPEEPQENPSFQATTFGGSSLAPAAETGSVRGAATSTDDGSDDGSDEGGDNDPDLSSLWGDLADSLRGLQNSFGKGGGAGTFEQQSDVAGVQAPESPGLPNTGDGSLAVKDCDLPVSK